MPPAEADLPWSLGQNCLRYAASRFLAVSGALLLQISRSPEPSHPRCGCDIYRPSRCRHGPSRASRWNGDRKFCPDIAVARNEGRARGHAVRAAANVPATISAGSGRRPSGRGWTIRPDPGRIRRPTGISRGEQSGRALLEATWNRRRARPGGGCAESASSRRAGPCPGSRRAMFAPWPSCGWSKAGSPCG